MGIPNNPVFVKTVSSQTDSKSPLLKATPVQLTEHGEVELVPTQSLHSYMLVSLAQEGTLHATKGEM